MSASKLAWTTWVALLWATLFAQAWRLCPNFWSAHVEAVGCGAHLEQLSRSAVGDLRLDDAQTLAEFEDAIAEREAGDEHIPGLIPASVALEFMPGIELSAAQVAAVRNGARLPGGPQEPVRFTFRGELIAIYGPAEEGHALKLLVKL